MKRVFYVFAIFIFIFFIVISCTLNYLVHSSIHKATEVKVKRDLEILATTTQGALAKNDYERVEEQVFLWGELEPHIISFEVILDDDIEIIKYAREIQSSHILPLNHTISLPSGRQVTFCIKYDMSEDHKEAAVMTTIFLSMSSCISVVFIFLLWRILQRLAFIPLNREIAERKQAEEERSGLSKILEGSLNEIYIFDAETLKFLLVNKGARINLGYSMEELKELCPLDLKTKLTAEFFDELLRPLRTKEKKQIGFIAEHQRKDGSFYDVEIHIEMATFRFRPVFVAIILDITERKQDQEQIQNLARFPSENPNPVLRIAKDGTILYSNKSGKLLLDKWGSGVGETVPDEWQSLITKAFQFEEVQEVEEIVEDRVFSITIASIKDAGYVNLYAGDITNRKRTEEQRKKLVKTLEYKNRELQDIVYTASHDLRSPLVNIEGFSGELEYDCNQLMELLAEHVQGGDKREPIELIIKENIPESLRFICSGAQKMSSLLDGLLQISRIGTIEIDSESLGMDKAVREILASMEHQIKKNNISVTVNSLPRCIGDLHMLDHVFTNLISNAIKYRNPAKECEIKISGKVEGNMSIYCVEDNGIGIAPDYQKKVFEIFHRLNPLDSVSGEGLGLTIVTRIMDRLGGKIWVESEPGKGSKFFVALPMV